MKRGTVRQEEDEADDKTKVAMSGKQMSAVKDTETTWVKMSVNVAVLRRHPLNVTFGAHEGDAGARVCTINRQVT